MLGHISTVQEVAEENRNYKVWTQEGLFDVERAYGFSRSTDQQSGGISEGSKGADESVVIGA